jgi:hypothetical protein
MKRLLFFLLAWMGMLFSPAGLLTSHLNLPQSEILARYQSNPASFVKFLQEEFNKKILAILTDFSHVLTHFYTEAEIEEFIHKWKPYIIP